MMTRHRMTNWIGMICAAVVLFGFAQTAAAANTYTMAGTPITNEVTVSYGIGTDTINVTQQATFVVDNRVDLSISTPAIVPVTPGQIGAVLAFTVANEGNFFQDYLLDVANDNADDFDPSSYKIWVEDGTTPGYQSGEDLEQDFIDELTPGDTIVVYIVANIPGANLSNEYLANLTITATTYDALSTTSRTTDSKLTGSETTENAEADDPTEVQVVFADGDATADGDFSATGTFQVKAAVLGVTKVSLVTWDPINKSANPKAIPGARVMYTITVTNTGFDDATSVIISDPIPDNCTYASQSMTLNNNPISDESDGDEGTYINTSGSEEVKVEGLTIPAGGEAKLVFKVDIN